MAGKGGGAWKVAYADFVTAMMAFFLVMWITSQNDKVKQAIAHYFNQQYQPPKRYTRSRSATQEEPKHVLQPVVPSLSTNPSDPQSLVPRVLTMREGDRTSMGTVVYFDASQTALDDEGRQALRRLHPWIVGKPQKIEIRGHVGAAESGPAATGADVTGPGTAGPDPWLTCYQRSLATRDFLLELGIPPERLRLSQAGPFEPLAVRDEPSWQVRPGRVEVFVLTEQVRDFIDTRAQRAEREQDH